MENNWRIRRIVDLACKGKQSFVKDQTMYRLLYFLFLIVHARHPMLSAFIVEPKLSIALIDSLLNARMHLPSTAEIILLTEEKNWAFFDQPVWHSMHLVLLRNESVPRSVNEYSKRMTECRWWQTLFHTDFVLVFQSDSRFCSGSPYHIEHFVAQNYPYIGAPWRVGRGWDHLTAFSHVGNGGFSLRMRSAMLDACTDNNTETEDIYFARYFKLNENRWLNAPISVAERFSAETYFGSNQTNAPLSIHKAHVYISDPRLQKLCPEYATLAQTIKL